MTVTSGQLDTSELVELLQQSAVEHLTTFRQFGAREFGSLGKMITTDYEALYAYKRGDYQRCLQLSTQNVDTLISAQGSSPSVCVCSEFIQLMDDDLVCLAGLMLLVVFSARQHICYSALYAIARPSVRLSVCPSVCPSVCHTGGSVKDV